MESFLYELKANIKEYGEYERYIEAGVKAKTLQDIDNAVTWIYADGLNAQPEEYKTKLTHFKSIGNPVKERYLFYTEIGIY